MFYFSITLVAFVSSDEPLSLFAECRHSERNIYLSLAFESFVSDLLGNYHVTGWQLWSKPRSCKTSATA